MAYDEHLADRVRDALADERDVDERKMFGGIAFMVCGHMCCGVLGDELIVRLGPEAAAEAVAGPHARPFDFTGRPTRNIVFVAPAGVRTTAALRGWVGRGLAFVRTLPPRPDRHAAPAWGRPARRGR